MPLCILPMGAVPKYADPFYQLILDRRYVNQFIDPWPVRYLSMAGLSLLIGRNSFMYLADLSAACLLTRLGGCGQEKIPGRNDDLQQFYRRRDTTHGKEKHQDVMRARAADVVIKVPLPYARTAMSCALQYRMGLSRSSWTFFNNTLYGERKLAWGPS
jgi:hypothetical protein